MIAYRSRPSNLLLRLRRAPSSGGGRAVRWMVMRPFGTARRSTGLLVAATVVAVDQVTKLMATHGRATSGLPEQPGLHVRHRRRLGAHASIIGAVLVLGRVPRRRRRARGPLRHLDRDAGTRRRSGRSATPSTASASARCATSSCCRGRSSTSPTSRLPSASSASRSRSPRACRSSGRSNSHRPHADAGRC